MEGAGLTPKLELRGQVLRETGGEGSTEGFLEEVCPA